MTDTRECGFMGCGSPMCEPVCRGVQKQTRTVYRSRVTGTTFTSEQLRIERPPADWFRDADVVTQVRYVSQWEDEDAVWG